MALHRAIPPVNPANPRTTGTRALSAPFAGAMVPGAAARSVRDAPEVRHAAANPATGGSRACVSPSSTDFDWVEAEEPADVHRHVVEIAPVVLVDAEPRRMASHSRERDARRFLHDVAELTCQRER